MIRESAETTKIRTAYDASAKPNKDSVSWNECLETRLPLQNSLWDILVRSTHLQIRIREPERDVSRFHWVKNSHPSVI